MQIGDIITGADGPQRGVAYRVEQPLGTPGLFGQAFLCHPVDRSAATDMVVVKTLRADRPAEDRERFFHEAQTLQAVAAVEEQAGVHYAVRLLAVSATDAPEPFLILEQATGQNVLDDLLESVIDWPSAPLDEQLALDIAWHLARALHYTHQAGICYDDMKLDNLFWRADQPDDPLRIIDWNVTSTVTERGGVAGDWARFGARLYQLRTGTRIGVDSQGQVIGPGPGGLLWQRLPEGTRDLIEQALGQRYTDDQRLLRDLERERTEARLSWVQLLERARIADGAGQAIEVLAPLWRAEQQLQAVPATDPQREDALAQCAELRQRAEARRGVASARVLDYGRQALARREVKRALELFEKAYADTGKRDPRPRRWLWLAQLAAKDPERYAEVRDDLEAAVEALNSNDPEQWGKARKHLGLATSADLPTVAALNAETEALIAAHQQRFDEAVRLFGRLNNLRQHHPDLQHMYEHLHQQQQRQQIQQRIEAEEQRVQQIAQEATTEAEVARQRGDEAAALRAYRRTLEAWTLLLRGDRSPTFDLTGAQRAQAQIKATVRELEQHAEAQALAQEALTLAQSADLQQRQQAAERLEQAAQLWPALLSDPPTALPASARKLAGQLRQRQPSLQQASELAERLATLRKHAPPAWVWADVTALTQQFQQANVTHDGDQPLADLQATLQAKWQTYLEEVQALLDQAQPAPGTADLAAAQQTLQQVRARLPDDPQRDDPDLAALRATLATLTATCEQQRAKQAQQAVLHKQIEQAEALWRQAQDLVAGVLATDPQHASALVLQQAWHPDTLAQRVQERLAADLAPIKRLEKHVPETLADDLGEITKLGERVPETLADDLGEIKKLGERVPETLADDLATLKTLEQRLNTRLAALPQMNHLDALAQRIHTLLKGDIETLKPQGNALLVDQHTLGAEKPEQAPVQDGVKELTQAAYALAQTMVQDVETEMAGVTNSGRQQKNRAQQKGRSQFSPSNQRHKVQEQLTQIEALLKLVEPHIPAAKDDLQRVDRLRTRIRPFQISDDTPEPTDPSTEEDQKKIWWRQPAVMIGFIILLLLLLVAVGGMVFMNRSNNSVVAGDPTATAMTETETPEVTSSPSPSPTATPVSFSATTITDFAPVDDINPVYAHTLAETSFDLITTAELTDTDVQRLSLRGATPAPGGDANAAYPPPPPNNGDGDNPQNESNQPNAPLPIISLVRADPPAPGSDPGQASTIRLQPADPGLSFPAEVWPLPTEPAEPAESTDNSAPAPTLTLTLYVDEEPTAFNFQVALQEQTVSGATPERKDAQPSDFFGALADGKPAAFLWQMPEQVEGQMVASEGGHAVVVNDDRVYLLAATETHYRVFVITAADLASQGQSGWIRREYIDGG